MPRVPMYYREYHHQLLIQGVILSYYLLGEGRADRGGGTIWCSIDNESQCRDGAARCKRAPSAASATDPLPWTVTRFGSGSLFVTGRRRMDVTAY